MASLVDIEGQFIPAADETKIFGIETETETRSLSGRDSRLRPESLRSQD